jgi:hypothetical protein
MFGVGLMAGFIQLVEFLFSLVVFIGLISYYKIASLEAIFFFEE